MIGQNEFKTQEELDAKWHELKEQKKVIDKRSETLYNQIENECYALHKQNFGFYEKCLGSAPGVVRELVESRKKLIKRQNNTGKHFWLLSILFSVMVSFLNTVYFNLQIVSTFVTYALFVLGGFLLSGICVKLYSNSLRKAIFAINQHEEMIKFDNEVSDNEKQIDDQERFIRTEKYRDDIKEISAFREYYDKIRKMMVKKECGDSAFFYFKQFGGFADRNVSYEIKIDGVDAIYSKSEKIQKVGVNPGYHTIDLVLESRDENGTKWVTFHFRVSEKELPLFVICDKVSGISGTCSEVTLEEFERKSGYKVLQ